MNLVESLAGALPKSLIDGEVEKELKKANYAPDVITHLLKYDVAILKGMEKVDKETGDKINNTTSSAAYKDAYAAVVSLGHNNAQFANDMATRYKNNAALYKVKMDEFSKAMERDPAFAKQVGELARAGNGTKIIEMADAEHTRIINAARGASAPSATTQSAVAGGGQATAGAGSRSTARTSNTTGTSAPAQSSGVSPAIAALPPVVNAAANDNLTAEEAEGLYNRTLTKNPKFKKYVDDNNLDTDMRAAFKKDPNAALKLVNEAEMSELMKKDKAAFMAEFKPFEAPKPFNLNDIMASMTSGLDDLSGIMDEIPGVGGTFGKFFAMIKGFTSGGASFQTKIAGNSRMFNSLIDGNGPPAIAKLLKNYSHEAVERKLADAATRHLSEDPKVHESMGKGGKWDKEFIATFGVPDGSGGYRPMNEAELKLASQGKIKAIGEHDGIYEVRVMTSDELAASASKRQMLADARNDQTLQDTLKPNPAVLSEEERRLLARQQQPTQGATPSPVPAPGLNITTTPI